MLSKSKTRFYKKWYYIIGTRIYKQLEVKAPTPFPKELIKSYITDENDEKIIL